MFALFLKSLPRALFTRKIINKTIKGGDVPRSEQSALTTVSTGVVPLAKKVLVSECCGEGCGSILKPNVSALNRTGANQAQNNFTCDKKEFLNIHIFLDSILLIMIIIDQLNVALAHVLRLPFLPRLWH
jgi:hypothetical protein